MDQHIKDLLQAASSGGCDVLQQLFATGTSVSAATAAGWTALHAAAMAGQLEAMQLLLAHSPPSVLAAKTLCGCTPLHSATAAQQPAAMEGSSWMLEQQQMQSTVKASVRSMWQHFMDLHLKLSYCCKEAQT